MNLRRLVFPLLLAIPLAAGCKQGENERCQLNSDCADGLTCAIPQGASTAEGGTCQAPATVVPEDLTAAPVDATVPEDQAPADGGSDGGG